MSTTQPAYFDVLPLHPQPEPLESLTSYLTRLAEANQFRSMQTLFKLCFPVERSKLTFLTGDYPPLSFGDLPTVACCPEPRLLATTFHHLGRKFNRLLQPQPLALFLSGSVAQRLRYCPRCLAERDYYSLVWRFLEITGCAEHGCQILDCCGHCGQTVPMLSSSKPKLGLCPTCGGDLRHCQVIELSESQWQVAQLRSRDMAFLVSPQPCEVMGKKLPQIIGASFTRWRQIRQLKVTDAAHYLNQSPSTIYHIENGPEHRGIKFQWYVEYADFLQVRLQDIFDPTSPAPPVLTYEEELIHKTQQAIVTLEQQGETVTQQAVIQMIGVVDVHIFTTYPQIRNLWAEYKARWQRQREDKLVNKVQQAIDCLKQQGKRVSRTAVSKMVGLTREGLKRCYPAAWTILVEQSEYTVIARTQLPKVRPMYQREDELVTKVQQAIESLRKQGESVTQLSISEIVGVSPSGLRYYPRVKAILQANNAKKSPQDEDELIDKVQVALIRLESAGIRVTQKEISAIVGVSATTLMNYPRVRTFVSTKIAEKHQEYRAKQRQQREDELVAKVHQAIELLTSGGRHVTQKAVCEIVEMSSAGLKSYPRVKLLLEQCGLARSRW